MISVCDGFSPFAQFSGSSDNAIGTETFLVKVEDALNSVGNKASEVVPGATWVGTFPAIATTTVSVSLVGPKGEIGEMETVDVFPTLERTCPGREIGRVRISTEGRFTSKIVAAEAPSVDNAFQQLEGEIW